MVFGMRSRFGLLLSLLVISVLLNLWYFLRRTHAPAQTKPAATAQSNQAAQSTSHPAASSDDTAPTDIYAHNLVLRKGPDFRIYVRWLRGQMTRSRPDVNPSFDNPDSFFLDVKTGVIRANVGDI